jgi:glycerol-1-phosphate dehydrogenase [NAD(P)+]
MCGLWTAPADWLLASIVGMDGSYHPAPLALLRQPSARLLEAAPGLRTGDIAAVDSLTRMLTISGIALGAAGSTAPMSGTEHLISHLIDLGAEARGRPAALHGAQVGVASVVAAAIWEVCLEELGRGLELGIPAEEPVRRDLEARFSRVDPTGRAAAECWRDCEAKLSAWREQHETAVAVVSDWDSHREAVTALLAPPERIANALREAGAVSAFDDLAPPVDSVTVRWAVENIPFIRRRFTVADLMYYAGAWTGELVERALDRASRAGIGW